MDKRYTVSLGVLLVLLSVSAFGQNAVPLLLTNALENMAGGAGEYTPTMDSSASPSTSVSPVPITVHWRVWDAFWGVYFGNMASWGDFRDFENNNLDGDTDLVLTNCTVASFAAGAEVYSFDITIEPITPQFDGTLSVQIPAGVAMDEGGVWNAGPVQFDIEFDNIATVTFDANSGTTPDPVSKVVQLGLTYGTLATTSRTGYTFAGWWTTAGGGVEVLSTDIVTTTDDHTLYAHWTANTYTVTFNANGGTGLAPTSKSVTYGATYGALATTSRTGYTFAGWWTTAGGGVQVLAADTVAITADTTLYAHWTALTWWWGSVAVPPAIANNTVSVADYVLVLRWVVGLTTSLNDSNGVTYNKGTSFPPCIDVNNNGTVTISDYVLILRKVVGLITYFTPDTNLDGKGPG